MRQEFFSVKEIAALAGFSPWTVRAWIDERKIQVVRFGRSIRIPRAEIEKMIGRKLSEVG